MGYYKPKLPPLEFPKRTETQQVRLGQSGCPVKGPFFLSFPESGFGMVLSPTSLLAPGLGGYNLAYKPSLLEFTPAPSPL